MRRERIFEIIIAFVLIVIFIILLCGSRAEALQQREYILGKGETLWEVYKEFGSGIKWQKWLYEMEKINGKSGNEAWYYGESIIVLVAQ